MVRKAAKTREDLKDKRGLLAREGGRHHAEGRRRFPDSEQHRFHERYEDRTERARGGHGGRRVT